MRDDDGNHVLDAWVPPPGYQGEDCKQGFGRHPQPICNAVQDAMTIPGTSLESESGLERRARAILQWMSELAPELINRCQVGRDGRTAYNRLQGKDSKKPIVEFGASNG